MEDKHAVFISSDIPVQIQNPVLTNEENLLHVFSFNSNKNK
jgi:hypothetical protein